MNRLAWLLPALAWLAAGSAWAQPTKFEHIVIIVQENRTPDSLFYTLCATQQCSTKQGSNTYDIQTSNWLDKNAKGGSIQPAPVPLANTYDLGHAHRDFVDMCDLDPQTKTCRMDGAGEIRCEPLCPPNAAFKFVANSQGTIDPYLNLATQYGWANYMFQTNQGPSFPAHQFLFGATSAPSKADDHNGTFASENARSRGISITKLYGCIALPVARVQLIKADGIEHSGNTIYPCFEHQTLGDLLDRTKISWRYYTPGPGSLWSAPDAIRHICKPKGYACSGQIWQRHMELYPPDVLSDVSACKLQGVSWVIPSAQYSDHAKENTGGGPAWVAGIVNAIGSSPCRNADNSTYWNTTAIVITWDDWGGWYDHEPPTFLAYPEGGYQYGFRVPMIFVSAYTKAGYINNDRLDFGTIARFVEENFGIVPGELTFADARANGNLSRFYNFSANARTFATIPAPAPSWRNLKLESPDDD